MDNEEVVRGAVAMAYSNVSPLSQHAMVLKCARAARTLTKFGHPHRSPTWSFETTSTIGGTFVTQMSWEKLYVQNVGPDDSVSFWSQSLGHLISKGDAASGSGQSFYYG
jgi:hypothetical protein